MLNSDDLENAVGPVLRASSTTQAVVAAIKELNSGVVIMDRGSYLRVLVPDNCRLSQASVEKHLGTVFTIPGDLELILTSFKGNMVIAEGEVSWSLR